MVFERVSGWFREAADAFAYHRSVFDLSPEVAGRPPVRILGIRHAGETEPLSEKVKRYLEAEISPEHLLAVEGTIGTRKSFLPNSMVRRAISLEHPFITDLSDRARLAEVESGAQERAGSFLKFFAKAVPMVIGWAVGRHLPLKKIAEPFSEERESRVFGNAGPHFNDFVRGFRSLYMAGEILRLSRERNMPLTVVMGAAHAGQVRRFLENPVAALECWDKLVWELGNRVSDETSERPSIFSSKATVEFDRILSRIRQEFVMLGQEPRQKH